LGSERFCSFLFAEKRLIKDMDIVVPFPPERPIIALRADVPPDVFITSELNRRAPKKTDYLQEKLALQDLARQMADDPAEVLPHLVDLALEICGGTSGGISLYEEKPSPGVFRWRYLRGSLAKFTGGTTPRDFSPCGVTLDLKTPVLAEHPERYYTWLVEAGIALPECLLVPLYVGSAEPLGTLWIVSPSEGHFDSGHARIMTELAAFAGIALQMVSTEDRLQLAFEKQEQLTLEQETLTQEMGHRVKNLFAIVGGMIRISARSAATPKEMSEILSGRLLALATAHAVVRRTFDDKGIASRDAELGEIVQTILLPHGDPSASASRRYKFDGPPIRLGDRVTNGFALVLHELATNAAKYGALKADTGTVQVYWRRENGQLILTWEERDGPAIVSEPTKQGFGSALSKNTVEGQLGGTLFYDWHPTGLLVTISVPVNNLTN
jgi:two-component sensor histidine kinase